MSSDDAYQSGMSTVVMMLEYLTRQTREHKIL